MQIQFPVMVQPPSVLSVLKFITNFQHSAPPFSTLSDKVFTLLIHTSFNSNLSLQPQLPPLTASPVPQAQRTNGSCIPWLLFSLCLRYFCVPFQLWPPPIIIQDMVDHPPEAFLSQPTPPIPYIPPNPLWLNIPFSLFPQSTVYPYYLTLFNDYNLLVGKEQIIFQH